MATEERETVSLIGCCSTRFAYRQLIPEDAEARARGGGGYRGGGGAYRGGAVAVRGPRGGGAVAVRGAGSRGGYRGGATAAQRR